MGTIDWDGERAKQAAHNRSESARAEAVTLTYHSGERYSVRLPDVLRSDRDENRRALASYFARATGRRVVDGWRGFFRGGGCE
jgi:hypothetical protein